jgi:hypothetical protein
VYCKVCGHCQKGAMEHCPHCGKDIHALPTAIEVTASEGRSHWAWVFALLLFGFTVHRFVTPFEGSQVHTTPAEAIAIFSRPEFSKAGLVGFNIVGSDLQVSWDLRWDVLGDYKQQKISQFVKKVWNDATGGTVQFKTFGSNTLPEENPNSGS